MPVGAVTLAGTGYVHAARTDKPQHQQRDRVPIADFLQHASANVVFHVQHEDPAWLQDAAALGPDRHVQRAVLFAGDVIAPEFPGVSGRPSVCR